MGSRETRSKQRDFESPRKDHGFHPLEPKQLAGHNKDGVFQIYVPRRS